MGHLLIRRSLLGIPQAEDKLHLAHRAANATGDLRGGETIVGQTIDFTAA